LKKWQVQMALYQLYLESGPMQKKTMVHVLDLPGCIACGPTSGEALERTPGAIRDYLRFLQRHGEQVWAEAEVTTQVAEHITEGTWLGNGDPTILFAPDKEPLTRQDLQTCLRRIVWSRAEIIALVSDLSEEHVEAKPPHGRSIKGILEHIFSAEYSYVRHFGKLTDIRGPGLHVQRSKEELLAWMAVVRASEISMLRTLHVEEPASGSTHAHNTRRILRRLLEHEWEHLVELKERLQVE
jgi:predicted RNase H-like HicB family nuclease/uncharacterized damage-inducible protein DinB